MVRSKKLGLQVATSLSACLNAVVHIVIVTGAKDAHAITRALGLDADVLKNRLASSVKASRMHALAGSPKVNTKKTKNSMTEKGDDVHVIISMFQPELPYTSMRALGRLAAGIHGPLCVHVGALDAQWHAPLMHVLGKHCYTFHKYTDKAARLHLKADVERRVRTTSTHDATQDINDMSHHDDYTSSKHDPADVTTEANAQRRTVYIYDRAARHDAYLSDIARALECVDIARDMENEPANRFTPEKFCAHVRQLFRPCQTPGLKVTVLSETEMEQAGLGLVLSVGRSSSFPPRFMVVEHRKNKKYPTICLVGKGVTFDAGGLRLKPIQAMVDMKQDKSGAAVVASIVYHIVKDHPELKVNLVGIMPMVENVISGSATKPGDIFRAHNGMTVEVTDPDAEGRLLLADAISYANEKFKPDYIIDFATLTAFASNICCDLSAAYYTPNDDLSALVSSLGEALGERVWRHPPWPEYSVQTLSGVADLRNAHFECTRSGSFMAAMFISNFLDQDLRNRWVHFDISNNAVHEVHSGNCALLGMRMVMALAESGRPR